MKLSSLFVVGFISFASAGVQAIPLALNALMPEASRASFLTEPPPAPGSEVDKADFRELHYWQKHRTQAQCASANREVTLILRTFVGSRTDLLSPIEEFKLTKDLSLLQLQVAAVTMDLKNRFNRPRPYLADRTLRPCLPAENSSSAYPSGHASSAYALAEALSSIFPRRADLFLERAQQIAFNRLIGGVHHRTDLVAGERLGRYYGRRFTRK